MSDALRLYQSISKLVNDMLPDMLEANRITLVQMITGIFRGQNVQFRKVAQKVWYRHRKSSLVDKFRRFVRNKNIEVEVEYLPFAKLILSALSTCQKQLVLAIDGTKIGGGCVCLMVSIHYKSRALPLCWLVYKDRKGHSSKGSGSHSETFLWKTGKKHSSPRFSLPSPVKLNQSTSQRFGTRKKIVIGSS